MESAANKPYNKISVNPVFEIDSIIFLANRLASTVVETPKKFDFWQLYYVKSGVLTIEQNGVPVKIPQNNTYIFSPVGDWRQTKTATDTEADFCVISFECSSPSLRALCDRLIPLYGIEAELISEMCITGWRILEPLKLNDRKQGLCEKTGAHPAVLQYLKLSLEQLLIRMYCREQHIETLSDESIKKNRHNYEKTIIKNINDYMQENLHRKLTVREIADALGMNETTLRITYKKETGQSIIKSFSHMKIIEAERLISSTDLNFTQISEKLGFLSIYHFSRFFKENMGITLSEYSKLISNRKRL